MTWYSNPPPQADGGWYGSRIMIHEHPHDWEAALLRVPAEHRQRAETYVRQMAARTKKRIGARREAVHVPGTERGATDLRKGEGEDPAEPVRRLRE